MICCGYPETSKMKGYATFCGGAIITITSPKTKRSESSSEKEKTGGLLTVTMRCIRSPGSGAFCVGQFEAQNEWKR